MQVDLNQVIGVKTQLPETQAELQWIAELIKTQRYSNESPAAIKSKLYPTLLSDSIKLNAEIFHLPKNTHLQIDCSLPVVLISPMDENNSDKNRIKGYLLPEVKRSVNINMIDGSLTIVNKKNFSSWKKKDIFIIKEATAMNSILERFAYALKHQAPLSFE